MKFKELGVIAPILKSLDQKGYTNPTPIQEKSIPVLLDNKDLLGCAQTGSGKTAAFTIPILQHLFLKTKERKGKRKIQALIITPTRELAIQIADNIKIYGKFTGLKNIVIYGGVKQHTQTSALKSGTDILVATPGRLLDLMNQGYISLKMIKFFVLDEADHMLDMGFIHDIKRIIMKLPSERQSLFFSATFPPAIVSLSKQILGNPEKVTISSKNTTPEKVKQKIYFVEKKSKTKLLIHLLKNNLEKSVLIFSRTKHGADKIVKALKNENFSAASIHGNKSQNNRQRVLVSFKSTHLKVLVATDIAARGIDIDDLPLVVNYDLPNIPETYIHRIGRTGRAQASGKAISFCSTDEKPYLRDIQKLIKQEIPIVHEHPFVNMKTLTSNNQKSKNEVKKNKKKNHYRSFKKSRGRNQRLK
jgi:ATP-dependent RNA helicase RhlE